MRSMMRGDRKMGVEVKLADPGKDAPSREARYAPPLRKFDAVPSEGILV